MKISPAVEDALWTAAERRLPPAVLAQKRLVEAVRERTRRYTSERERLGEALSGDAARADLAARALFFAVTDSAKLELPLAELAARDLVPSGAPLRVLDLGAGAGAMTLGLAGFLSRTGRAIDLAVVAVDRDAAALELMVDAAAALRFGRIAIEARVEDVRRARITGPVDLVLIGGLLNELGDDGAPLLDRALAALGPAGALIAIEPALRETSRALHRLRDRVIERGAAHVFAPCTRSAAPCPALHRERDWCHEDRPLALTPRAAGIAAATGLRDTGIKFSYLVLRREPSPLVAPRPGRAALRVVSEPLKAKGRRELTACGDQGWVPLRLLKRHRSDATRPFERARRGDVLLLPPDAPPSLRRDLTGSDPVERIAAETDRD